MNKRIKRQPKGQVMVLFALMIFTLLGFAGLAIDVGHLYVVRNQLQNAADAAALSGANYLYPPTSSGPNWTSAQTKALSTAKLNSVDGAAISTATIQTGYWNIKGSPSTLQATSITPGQYDCPAVRVTVTKSSGINGGAVPLFFGSVLGIKTANVSANAVAVVGSPQTIPKGKLFPLALDKSIFDSYWDSDKNAPKVNSFGSPQTIYVLGIFNMGGTMTSFNYGTNSLSVFQTLIRQGSNADYSVGDSIWIASGISGLISNLLTYIPMDVDVIVPIVENLYGWQTIVAFGAIHIDSAFLSSLQIHLITNIKVADSPGGYSYGVYTPSRLAN